MKFKDAVNNETIVYERWHADIRAVMTINDDLMIVIGYDDIHNFITGLRGEQQTSIWDRNGQDILLSAQGQNITIQQKYMIDHGRFGRYLTTLSKTDAGKIADDLEDMLHDPKRIEQHQHAERIMREHSEGLTDDTTTTAQ